MKNINLFKSLKHDYMFLSAILFFVLLILFSLYGVVFHQELFLNVFTLISTVFLILGILRYLVLRSYFMDSHIIEGTVVFIWFHKDRGRISYVYSIGDVIYKRGLAVMKTKETRDLQKGSIVNVIYKTKNPIKSLLVDLYS